MDLSWASAHLNYRYLTKSSCFELQDIDDVKEFENTIAAMQTVGIPDEEQLAILAVSGAVLYIGNIIFEAPPENSEGAAVTAESRASLEMASDLIGISSKTLEESLCFRTIKTRNEEYLKPLRIFEAEDCRDALARALYGTLFVRIVQRTNQSIGYDTATTLFCGVLDIFGFECFKMNSFEQLCINFTNERLQQFFNSFIFKCEEALYREEKIPWDPLDFPDNQDCVDLLQGKPHGLFSMLDEECIVVQGSDKNFNSKIIRKHATHARFGEIKTKPDWFAVQHFAGPVHYCSNGFLDKNKDQLSPDTQKVVSSSPNEFVASLFRDLLLRGEQGGSKKQATVSSEFKTQLGILMETVNVTEPHFIRCIKPNAESMADRFERKSVTEQLRYGGVLQAVQVSRAGYPVRVPHKECFDDYKYLAPSSANQQFFGQDNKEKATRLMRDLAERLPIPAPKHGATSWAVGASLVFFKHEAYEILQSARMILHSDRAILLQSRWKGTRQRYFYLTIRRCTITIQALMRGKISRKAAERRRKEKAAVSLQAFIRRVLARVRYIKMIHQIVTIQAVWRGGKGRLCAHNWKRHKAATMIQSLWRGSKEKARYDKLRAGVLKAQLQWRSKCARRQLRRLRQEQKETATLLTQKQNLQQELHRYAKELQDKQAHIYKIMSERDELQREVESLKNEINAMKQGDVAAAIAAKTAKIASQPQQPDSLALELQTQVERVEMELAQQKKENHELSQKYLTVVESGNLTYRLPPDAPKKLHVHQSRQTESQKSVDILIIGGVKVGKTQLLKTAFMEWNDTANLESLETYANNDKSLHRYKVKIENRELSIIDVPGEKSFDRHIADLMPKANRILIVFNLADADGQERTTQLLKLGGQHSNRSILFGNKHDHDRNQSNCMVDIATLKDVAAGFGAKCVEGSNFSRLLQNIARELEHESAPAVTPLLPAEGVPQKERKEFGSGVTAIFKNMMQGPKPGQPSGGEYLNYSAKGKRSVFRDLNAKDPHPLSRDVVACNEIRGSESAVTCIAFGQEKMHTRFVLLAVAAKDGTVVVYRVYRTEIEVELLKTQPLSQSLKDSNEPEPQSDGAVEIHQKLFGHQRAITSLFFNLLEDRLVTTSIDGSVRIWDVESGEMVRIFTDSAAALFAAFLPFNPALIVASNANSVLRFFNVENGHVIQKLKLESQVRTICFDDSGLFCLAGTRHGTIHVLEAFDATSTRFKFKFNLTKAAITCIEFVRSTTPDAHPCLLVNATDNYVAVVDCMYGPPSGELTNLLVRYRIKIEQIYLPLRCCHSPAAGGWLITGSEGSEVIVHSLRSKARAALKYHKHPVLCVAINQQSTLLASADSSGLTVLWRRFDMSHIEKLSS
eukprot:GHVN01089204.1.p1 GENE.GHVN01089204.1~~GHVN01089204.1.p1  ORF type:complete len:1366 (+),score=163.96 GHVN01089204.1:999-5096(+)